MTFADIINLFHQGKATARSHIKNLIEIAAADGRFANEEEALLAAIASRNNISEKRLSSIKNDPSSIHFEVPTDSREKFRQLYDLVHMMSIDQNVHVEERRLCELFALKFGYKREQVAELIESLKANIQNKNGPEEALKRIGSDLQL